MIITGGIENVEWSPQCWEGRVCEEHQLMCGHGNSPPDLLVFSKVTNLLNVVDAGDKDALRHEGLRTTLSQIAIRNGAVTEIKVSEETLREVAH